MPATTPPHQKVLPRKKPQQQRASARVELIVQSYLNLLDRDEGRITTNKIASEANIPVSSLYQYFPNKEAIACTVYSKWAEQGIAILKATREQAIQAGKWDDFFAIGNTDFFGEIVGAKIVHQLAPIMTSTPELKEVQKNYLKQMIAILADIIRELGSDWPDEPLHNIASLIIELNTSVFHHMARQDKKMAAESHRHWQQAALKLLERCIGTPYEKLECK